MTTPGIQNLEVTTKNTASLTMGICSVAVGVLALLVGWMPFIGLVAIPAAIIGLLLAGVGVVLAVIRGGKGFGLPVLGGVICAVALILPILSTGGASAVVAKSMEESARRTGNSSVGLASSQQGNKAESQKTAEEVEKEEYIKSKISLYEVEVKYWESRFEGKIPGATFKLKNLGDRSLDKVELTIYFKDKTGSIISEESYHPVLVSTYSMGNDNKPLKPGYVWQMESGKFFGAKKVPVEWVEGSYDVKITNIRFSK